MIEIFSAFNPLYALLGVISGIASGMFGIGGGMIIVPAMLFLGLSSHHAISLSVLQMIFASVFGSFLNYKKGNLDLKDGVFVGLGGLFGASFSGVIVSFFSDIALTSVFLALSIIFFTKYALAVKNRIVQHDYNLFIKKAILFGAGALTGVFAISLGIGGGLLIAPILGYFLGYDSKRVVPLALFFVVFASVAGTFSFYMSGVINASVVANGVAVGIGSLLGVWVGIKIIANMKTQNHHNIMLCVYALSIIMTSIGLMRKIWGF